MRLWHQSLIPALPRQQLLGQHRECAALRGAGWGRKHSTVDYVFTHDRASLVAYHFLIMDEMERRGYHPDPVWRNVNWRGNKLGEEPGVDEKEVRDLASNGRIIYPEHNDEYLHECIENLHNKGIEINI
jgi:uncharacterized protein (TIGR02328 family)